LVENGKLTGELDVLNERTWEYNEKCIGCCICKVDFLLQLCKQLKVTKSFAVGDGRSDECLFQHVDVSFSLNPQYNATYRVKDLSDVLKILEDL
jgi:phosphoserine phosphatase